MGTRRAPRLVCNPGLTCTAAAVDRDSELSVVDVSRSGIALAGSWPGQGGVVPLELSIQHRARAADGPLGSQQPLRVRAAMRREEPLASRICLEFEQEVSEQWMRELRQADHEAYVSDAERWGSDRFLDQLARAGDFAGDELDEQLTLRELHVANAILDGLRHGDPIPDDALPELRAFLQHTATLPSWIDLERADRGRKLFLDNAIAIGIVLFLKVLPTGYCAPALARALGVSGDAQKRPVRRSLLVLQMLLDLCDERAFDEGGPHALLTAQRLRLLHAGVRRIIRNSAPRYVLQFGAPVNQEHMVATIFGFSYETLRGLRQLKIGWSRAQEEDFCYLWLVYAWMLGLHPEGQDASRRHFPETLEAAEAFQRAYRRRNFKSAAENPDGVQLAEALLEDICTRLSEGLPKPLAHRLPRWLLRYFLSGPDLRRLGIERSRLQWLANGAIALLCWLMRFVRFIVGFFANGPKAQHAFVMRILSGVVKGEFGQVPKVRITADVEAMRDLVEATTRPPAGSSPAVR